MPGRKNASALAILRALPDIAPPDVAAALDVATDANPGFWIEPLSSAEAAETLGVAEGTLAQWRHRGEGPPWYKADGSRTVKYPSRLELLQWQRDEFGMPPITRRPS